MERSDQTPDLVGNDMEADEGRKRERRETVVKVGGYTRGIGGFLVLGGALVVAAIATRALKSTRANAAEKGRKRTGGSMSSADGEIDGQVETDKDEIAAPPVASHPRLLPGPQQPPPPRHEPRSIEIQHRQEDDRINTTPPTEVDESLAQEDGHSHSEVESRFDHGPSQAQDTEHEETQRDRRRAGRGFDDDRERERDYEEEEEEEESEQNTESTADDSSNESNTDSRWPAEASESSTTSLEGYGMKLQHDLKAFGKDVKMMEASGRAILLKKWKGLLGFISTLMAVVVLIVLLHGQQERVVDTLHQFLQVVFPPQESFQQT